MVVRREGRWSLRVLEELFCLGVVLGLDLGVVDEVSLDALVVDELETVAVERVGALAAGDVGHGDVEGVDGSVIRLGAAVEVSDAPKNAKELG